MNKLNLGCGKDWKILYPNYVGLDIIDFGQAYIADIKDFLNEWTGDDYWDEIMANHFLEHFDADDIKIILNGVYRLLKVGGLFRITVPHKDREAAWVLPHKYFFTEETFRSLVGGESKGYGYGNWELVEMAMSPKQNIHVLLRKI